MWRFYRKFQAKQSVAAVPLLIALAITGHFLLKVSLIGMRRVAARARSELTPTQVPNR
jgi:hypothetical protein